MNIAIIKSNEVINTAVFDDLDTARQFHADGVFGDADTVAELPEGYGIGDSYDGESWTKKPEPPLTVDTSPSDPLATLDALAIDHEIRLSMLELGL